VKKIVDKATAAVHKQYNDKGLYVSDDDDTITDPTKIGGDHISAPTTKVKTNSPLKRSIARYKQ